MSWISVCKCVAALHPHMNSSRLFTIYLIMPDGWSTTCGLLFRSLRVQTGTGILVANNPMPVWQLNKTHTDQVDAEN